jgi:hypothetical protein
MKKIAFFLVFINALIFAQGHFTPVNSTGLPYHIIVSNATVDGRQIRAGEEIAFFDDTLCVGSTVVSQNGMTNIDVVVWQKNDAYGLPGFTVGDSIKVKIWVQSYGIWKEVKANLTFSLGNGTFGNGIYSVVTLTATTGLKPVIQISPQTVEFGAVNIGQNSQKTVTITNNGNADLTISQIVSASGNISIGGYNSLVAPNSSVTVNLTFSPSIAQPYTGNINISSDDPDSPVKSVPFTGQGLTVQNAIIEVTPVSLDFGNVPVGQIATQTMIIKNNGNATLTVSNILSNNNTFTVSEKNFSIAAGRSKSITVTFTPTNNVQQAGNLTIYNTSANNSSLNVNLQGRGFTGYFNPVIPTGLPYTIILNNVAIDNFSLSTGDEVAVFDGELCVGVGIFTGSFPLQLTAWKKNSDPEMPGFSDGDSIKFKVYGTAYGSKFLFSPSTTWLTGNGLFGSGSFSAANLAIRSYKEPVIQLSRTEVNFGTVNLGDNKTDTITVYNNGMTTLVVNNIYGSNGVFSATPVSTLIEAGQSKIINLKFTPTAAVPYDGNMTFNSNDPYFPNINVKVTGFGIPAGVPLLSVDTSKITFSQTKLNDTTKVNLVFRNDGTSEINVSAVDFSMPTIFSSNKSNFIIPVGGSVPVELRFSPKSILMYDSYVNFVNNSQNSPNLRIPLRGLGYTNFLGSVAPTGKPYRIVLDSVKFNNSIVTGDEIGFFDGELCVGSVAIGDTGKYNGIAWGEDPGNGLPGFIEGDSIKIKYYSRKNSIPELLQTDFSIIEGDGTFGSAPYTSLNLNVIDLPVPTEPIGLVYPENNSKILVPVQKLAWSKNIFASSYRVQVSTDSTFQSTVINSVLTDTILNTPQLNPFVTYYWRVAGINRVGQGYWAAPFKFRTLRVHDVITLINPAAGAVNQPINTLKLSWQEPALINNNEFFHIQVTKDTTSTNFILNDSTVVDTLKSINNLQYLTKYYWRVSGKNETGWGPFSPYRDFTTIIEKPTTPVLAIPLNNSKGLLNPITAKWNKSDRVEKYNLQVSTDSLFGSFIVNDSTITDTTKILPTLTNYSQYYWRVKAVNVGGESDWSSLWNFKTLGNPYASNLLTPLDVSVNQPIAGLTFKWTKALERIETIQKYQLQISTDSLFSTTFINDSTLTDTSKIVNGFGYLTKYFWRVRAQNQTGWGDWSNMWRFTTIIEKPTIPVLAIPLNNSKGLLNPITTKWNQSLRAEKYKLQVSTDNLFTSFIVDDSTLADTTRLLPGSYKLFTILLESESC